MAELEKLKVHEKMYKAFSELEVFSKNSLEKAYNSITTNDSTGSSSKRQV
jgi:hypothetical protein